MLISTSLRAQYNYYTKGPLNNPNDVFPVFVFNGATSNTSSGLTIPAPTGGSYISRSLAPDGTDQYEVAATLNLPVSGGNYVLFLDATSNAILGSTSVGSFYAFAIQNPTFSNDGCTATATLYKVVSGSVTQISSSAVPCSNGVVYHAIHGVDNALRLWVNGVTYLSWTDTSSPLTGLDGFGGYSMPSGNTISYAELGSADRIAPSQVASNSIQTYPLSNEVDIQTSGSADDQNGSGINGYIWYRNGVQVASTQTPEWSDVAASPGSTQNYGVQAQDHHGNVSAITTFSVGVPSNATVDARETGIRPTGSYWGGMGEQIDTRSGNLNYSYPLIKAISRGWSVPIGISYNSQNSRLDTNGNPWKLGDDLGFGFGWKMQIGSLAAFYSSYLNVQFYEYSDASGATYRLTQNTNGIWTSTESVYVTYDSNAQRLYFNDGSFWVMGCTSAGTEQDAGTMYPTLLQDSNGNQVTVQYLAGAGVTWVNSSARVQTVQDVRPGSNPAGSPTFEFWYNSDTVPHLTNIGNFINSNDTFTLSYSPSTTLNSPFGGSSNSFGSAPFLSSINNRWTNLTTSFTYDSAGAGELTQVTLPLGGYIRWVYGNAAYPQTTVREVTNRYLEWDPNIGERAYNFRSVHSGSNLVPTSRQLTDVHAGALKAWNFSQTAGATFGLVTSFNEGSASAPQSPLRTTNYTWSQNSSGNNYIARLQTVSDPGQSYSVTAQSDQSVDAYGNVTQSKLYDYSNLSNATKTYNTTYLINSGGTNYTSLYIRNRVSMVTVTDSNGITTNLKQNTYDQYPNGITPTPNIAQQDAEDYGPSFTARGNLYTTALPWVTWRNGYDQTGAAIWNGNNVNPNAYVSTTRTSNSNYGAPEMITTGNSLNTTIAWTQSMQVAGTTGPNSDNTTIIYDSTDRPSQKISPYGANTYYYYNVSAPQITQSTNGRTTKTYLDGLGRPAHIDKGDSNSTQSVTESVYDSCGCSAMGKLLKQSMPHAPGAPPAWTSYTYDSLGRVLTATRPDGQSTSTYSYAGNTVMITDPIGKWKKITRDVYGQIIQVVEPSPHPASEPNHVTLYTYDTFGHLTQVQMPRTIGGTVRTQTRSWVYNPQTLQLVSKTSPESGTVSYTYNADGTRATVTDAKNQRKVYTYDSYQRVIQIARGTVTNGTFVEDTTQRTTYAYEGTNGGYSSSTAGRVSQIQYSGPDGLSFTEMYSYHPAGAVTYKRLQAAGTPFGSQSVNMDAHYSYNNEGQVTSIATRAPSTFPATTPAQVRLTTIPMIRWRGCRGCRTEVPTG